MIRTGFVRALSAALLCYSMATLAGCSATPSAEARTEQSGTLSLPLSVSVGDHLYRFRYFQAYLYPYGGYLSSTGETSETVLKAQLPTGHYQVQLWSWALDRDDGLGNFVPVQAELVSSPYLDFDILNGSTTTVSYQFETDGHIITVGSGGLSVAARINERAPVCAPLSSDCGEGQWCPPGELTGAPLACRYAGSVELGVACTGPADCVANSSCIDLGAGPTCVALCSSAEFDAPCSHGGTCTAVGSDYGVCTSSPGE